MRANTPDSMQESVDPPPDHDFQTLDAPQSPHAQGRQKSTAAVQSFHPQDFLAKMSGPPTEAIGDILKNVQGRYVVPDGAQAPGVESDGYRISLKRKAEFISRSQYETYSFSTKYNLPEAAVSELLEMLSNVCNFLLHTNSFNSIIRRNT